MRRPDELDCEEPSPYNTMQAEQVRGKFAAAGTRSVRAQIPHLDPRWRSPLLPSGAATPLETLLDPGRSLMARTALHTDPQGHTVGWSAGSDLTSMAQLETWQLLELPEMPAHRAPRSYDGQPIANDWRLRPPSERGRHEAHPQAAVPEEEDFLPPSEPRAYVLGYADEATVDASLEALRELELMLPDIGTSTHMRLHVPLGSGESAFLNARSALWSWRPQRQAGTEVHTHGPPLVGRDFLLEQKIGLTTVLQGCRVMTLDEEARRWGFTIGSLDRQVYRLWERLLVEWHPDQSVTLSISSHYEVRLRGFGLIGPLLSNARRNTVQGYARAMADLAEV